MRFGTKPIQMPKFVTVDMQAALVPMLEQGANALKDEIIALLEPHNKTGALIGSWRLGILGRGFYVYSDDPAASVLNYGTRKKDYPIAAKRKKMLHFFEIDIEDPEDQGFDVFAKRVVHPGVTGIHYVQEAEAAVRDSIYAAVQEAALQAIATKLGRPVGILTSAGGKNYYGIRSSGGQFAKII